jgi:hypothetical protein
VDTYVLILSHVCLVLTSLLLVRASVGVGLLTTWVVLWLLVVGIVRLGELLSWIISIVKGLIRHLVGFVKVWMSLIEDEG